MIEPRRTRTVVGLLTLASVTILTLDARHGAGDSPVDPLRSAVSAVLGPVEDGATEAFAPLIALPEHFDEVDELLERNSKLAETNDELTRQLRASDAGATRAAEISGIARLGDTSGFDLVQAQVVGLGSAQTFSRTVTIDAGTSSGIVPDLTVINADGLVGRVLDAERSTATVLLIIDSKSTVGGRLGHSMELGFLGGDGDLAADGTLQLSLVDHEVTPAVGDTVLTWGSRNGAPYVAGVPIGEVTSVRSSPVDLTETAEVDPFADFSSLDIVGVVVSTSDQTSQLAGGAR